MVEVVVSGMLLSCLPSAQNSIRSLLKACFDSSYTPSLPAPGFALFPFMLLTTTCHYVIDLFVNSLVLTRL